VTADPATPDPRPPGAPFPSNGREARIGSFDARKESKATRGAPRTVRVTPESYTHAFD